MELHHYRGIRFFFFQIPEDEQNVQQDEQVTQQTPDWTFIHHSLN